MTNSGTRQPPIVRAAVAVVLHDTSYNHFFAHPEHAHQPPAAPDPLLLIARRPHTTVYGGYWEFPGGKLEPDEAPADTAVREAREELGISITPLADLPPITHRYEHATVHLHPVLARLQPSSPPPQNIHADAHRWCPLSAIPWDSFLPANVRIITRLLAHLAQQPAPPAPPGAPGAPPAR